MISTANMRMKTPMAACGLHAVNERRNKRLPDEFSYTASCPICEKRVFDVSDLPHKPVKVRLKCPHCRKIVDIPFSGEPP